MWWTDSVSNNLTVFSVETIVLCHLIIFQNIYDQNQMNFTDNSMQKFYPDSTSFYVYLWQVLSQNDMLALLLLAMLKADAKISPW